MNNITLNEKSIYNLKLTLTSKENLGHKLVATTDKKITLISELNTYFVYFEDKEKLTRDTLYNLFVNLNVCCQETYDIDIDVTSFANKNISEAVALQTIYEALIFNTAKTYSLKAKQKSHEVKYNLITDKKVPDYTSLQQIETQGYYVNVARELQDTPPNLMYPEIFANRIKQEAKDIKNLTVKILNKTEIEKLRMGLLLAVNAGSYHEPRVVVLEYKGDNDNKDEILGLVGKGITFDSGGYSLKPSSAMKGMKYDMSGAAIVCNSALAAAKLGLKVNFVAVACLTENCIGGKATLVETVATSMSGLTVEINNTDAEGRLVLADGITYAIEKGKANKVIELSTLTGAILIALGDYMTGAFTNDDKLYNDFLLASEQSNEEIWRMPIHKQNTINMKSSIVADLSNIAKTNYGGSSNAAAFLQEFSKNTPLLHLDIAGTAYKTSGKAVHVKTLVQYMKNNNK